MADYVKVRGVAAADIVKIDGVAVADVVKCEGATKPASGATLWMAVAQHGAVGYASNSDRTAWTSYDNMEDGAGTPNGLDIAYGKDSNGDGIFICTRDSSPREIQVSGTDPTSAGDWTVINLEGVTGVDQYCIRWGPASDGATAGTWVAIGQQSGDKLYRSTDGGGSFSSVDLSGLSGHTSTGITGLACSDTAGTWAFAQGNRFYISTDNAASWAVSTPWSTDTPVHIFGICFTNSSWVIAYKRGSSALRFRSCAASDITDWGSEYDASGNAFIPDTIPPKRVSMAAANGRVCLIGTSDDCFTYFDVSGKVISNIGEDNKATADDINGLATDGTTWIGVAEDGDVWESSDGASWSLIVNGHTFPDGHTNDDWESVAPNVFLPL
tara:strand:+ start:12993 stop:14141 length:1149 start_codon:yes stop_codon:yes gene_type:complete